MPNISVEALVEGIAAVAIAVMDHRAIQQPTKAVNDRAKGLD